MGKNGCLQSAIHGKIGVAAATVSLLETYHGLVEDYGVEREEVYRVPFCKLMIPGSNAGGRTT